MSQKNNDLQGVKELRRQRSEILLCRVKQQYKTCRGTIAALPFLSIAGNICRISELLTQYKKVCRNL